MEKIATITPINCLTGEQYDAIFVVYFDATTGKLIAKFAQDIAETLDYTAKTIAEARDIVYSLYATSSGYIYEPEE